MKSFRTMPTHQRDTSRARRALALCAGLSLVLPLGLTALAGPASAATTVMTESELESAVHASGTVTLGADITIDDATGVALLPGLTVTLDLAGHDLTVTGVADGLAAIDVPTTASLTIADTGVGGTLTVVGGQQNAGIAVDGPSGSLTVAGGIVSATGGAGTSLTGSGAGIGGSDGGTTGPITVSGGSVTALGGPGGAGIGGGSAGTGALSITITGGEVHATGGPNAAQILGSGAGIGGGAHQDGGTIRIDDGTVTATGGNDGGSGVGGGANGGSGGSITITHGSVSATGAGGGTGIGGGNTGAGGSVTISGGSVDAQGSARGAGIGGAPGGTISITGGTVSAVGGNVGGSDGGAGIGTDMGAAGGAVTIGSAAVVTAAGGGPDVTAVGASAPLNFDQLGTVSNAGSLTIPAGAGLLIAPPAVVQNSGVIDVRGQINGLVNPNDGSTFAAGTLANAGTILTANGGTVEADGQGPPGTADQPLNSHLLVTGHNTTLAFDTGTGSNAPSPAPTAPTDLHVYATSISDAGLSLPTSTDPRFTGWFTSPTGGTEITDDTNLTTALSLPTGADAAPVRKTLYAQYVPLRNPSISASVSSSGARHDGWYDVPVTVTFTCASGSSPLTHPCPAPVRLSRDGAGQSVSATITGTDGGSATATVSGINIDRTSPRVRIAGIHRGHTYHRAPAARCRAIDALSGVATCHLTKHGTHRVDHRVVRHGRALVRHGRRLLHRGIAIRRAHRLIRQGRRLVHLGRHAKRVRVTAVALDIAGNRSTAHTWYYLLPHHRSSHRGRP